MRAIGGAHPLGPMFWGSPSPLAGRPCIGPQLGAILSLAASEASVRQGHFAAGGLCSGAGHSVLAGGDVHHPRDGGDEQNQTPHEAHRAVDGDFIDPCGPCDGHRGFYVAWPSGCSRPSRSLPPSGKTAALLWPEYHATMPQIKVQSMSSKSAKSGQNASGVLHSGV